MKKIISVMLVLALTLSSLLMMIPVSAAPAGDPITDAEGFLAMDPTGKYYLDADITLDEMCYQGVFKGTFDGNGKSITLEGEEVRSAFNEVNGIVKNLTIKGDVSAIDTNCDMAGVALYGNGTFENIVNEANFDILMNDAEDEENGVSANKKFSGKIGGIIAVVNGKTTIKNCKNVGNITISTYGDQVDHWIGGIVGASDDAKANKKQIQINDCVNEGEISSTQACAYLGGIVGSARNARFQLNACHNKGNITVSQYHVTNGNSAYTAIGGMIAGTAQGNGNTGLQVLMTNCINDGNLEAKVADETSPDTYSEANTLYVGGMLGRALHNNDFYVNGCINNGTLTTPENVTGWTGAGGMIGSMMTIGLPWAGGNSRSVYQTIMENCKNYGDITGFVSGGMWGSVYEMHVGKQEIRLQYCENEGDIYGTSNAGGLVGQLNEQGSFASNMTVKNCRNKGAIDGAGYSAGIIARFTQIGNEYVPTISDCVSEGTVTTSAPAESGVAAGIVGHLPMTKVMDNVGASDNSVVDTGTPTEIIIKNCVVVGALTGADMGVITKEAYVGLITAENNVYKTGLVESTAFATAQDNPNTNIKTTIASMALLIAALNGADGFLEIDYTADSWAAYQAAVTEANRVRNLDSDTREQMEQSEVDAVQATLEEAIAGLVKKPVDWAELDAAIAEAEAKEKGNYTSTSFLRLTSALKNAKDVKATADLQSVANEALEDLKKALEGLETKKDKGSSDITTEGGENGGTAGGDTAATDAVAGEEEEKGCGSAITATAVVLGTVLALGAGVAFKKKED